MAYEDEIGIGDLLRRQTHWIQTRQTVQIGVEEQGQAPGPDPKSCCAEPFKCCRVAGGHGAFLRWSMESELRSTAHDVTMTSQSSFGSDCILMGCRQHSMLLPS